MLLNKARAYEVMDREGLDGLVAVSPINVYYLSDFWGALMRMRRTFYNYAVLPRREDAPAGLVLSGVELLRLHHRPAATWMPNRYGYVHPVYQDRRDFDPTVEDPEAVEHGMKWPIHHATLGPSDREYLQYVDSLRGSAAVNATYALKRALVDAGLGAARVGSDDPRVGPWLNQIGLPKLVVREATTTFRDIRMVKTPDEITLLRRAARINEESLEVVIDSLRVGLPRDELEITYNTEVARRGGRGIYLSTGQSGKSNHLGGVLANEPIVRVRQLPRRFGSCCRVWRAKPGGGETRGSDQSRLRGGAASRKAGRQGSHRNRCRDRCSSQSGVCRLFLCHAPLDRP
jgi:Xaa-Pro aminopeptidase